MKVLDVLKDKGDMTVKLQAGPEEFGEALLKAYARHPEKYIIPGLTGQPTVAQLEQAEERDELYDQALDLTIVRMFEEFIAGEDIMLLSVPDVSDVFWPDEGGVGFTISASTYPVVSPGQYKGVEVTGPFKDDDEFEEAVLSEAASHIKAELPEALMEKQMQGIVAQEKAIVSQDPIYNVLSDVIFMLGKAYEGAGITVPEKKLRDESMDIMLQSVAKDEAGHTKERFCQLITEAVAEKGDVPQAFADELEGIIELRRTKKGAMSPEQQVEDIFDAYMGSLNISREDWEASRRELAARQLKQDLLLDAVAKAEQFTATADEVEAAYAEIAKQYEADVKDIKESLPVESVKWQLCREKARHAILESAVRLK